MFAIAGKFMGAVTRRVEPNRSRGQSFEAFDAHEATLLIERPDAPPYTLEVSLAGRDIDLEALPRQGEPVAFECSVQARAKGDRAYITYKAWRRLPEIEALLAPASV